MKTTRVSRKDVKILSDEGNGVNGVEWMSREEKSWTFETASDDDSHYTPENTSLNILVFHEKFVSLLFHFLLILTSRVGAG